MFQERLKKCREEKGFSQIKMADMLKITRQAYNHYETGTRLPTQETLVVLANFLGVSTDYLLGRTDNPAYSNPLDKELEGFEFALWGEVKELTDIQKQDILDYIRYKRSKENTNETDKVQKE